MKKTETISVYATVIVGRINRPFHLTFLFNTTVQMTLLHNSYLQAKASHLSFKTVLGRAKLNYGG